jgi:uncharacterized protein with von Willebrand factor type A (vWA) domain
VAEQRSGGYDVTDSVVGLARTLRAAGVDAGPERVHATITALGRLDVSRRADVYWAGRLTLCGSADDVVRYDRVFAAYFGQRPGTPAGSTAVLDGRLRLVHADDDRTVDGEADDDVEAASLAASRTEVLRQRDISTLSPADRAALHRLLAAFPPGEASPIRTALVTARSAPAHERVIRTLRDWGVRLDEALFLGGRAKGPFLQAFGADIFFDDSELNIASARDHVAAGHVPHGVANP